MNSSLGSEDVKNILNEELYAQHQVALSDKDKRIELLEAELVKYKLNDYAVENLTEEIRALYPSIESFSLGLNKVYDAASEELKEVVVASIQSSDFLETSELEKIQNWIQARVNGNQVTLHITQPEPELEALEDDLKGEES